MRKILLSTSAMIGLTFAIGNINDSIANPGDPKLTVNGKTHVSTYYVTNETSTSNSKKITSSDKEDITIRNPYKKHPVTTRVEDSNIKLKVKGSTETFGGLDYELLITLSGDTNNSNKPSVSENAITLGSQSYGKISFGDTLGPDGNKESAQSIIGGLGGFYGNLKDIIVIPKEVVWDCRLTGSPGKSTKLIYTSPRIEGLQLAASLTPNTQQKGTKKLSKAQKSTGKPFDYNNVVGLLSYKSNLNGIDVGISLTGVYGIETGQANKITYNKSKSYAIGGKIGYDGWEIGAEYINNMQSYGKEQYKKIKTVGKIINVGISYTFGQSKISFGLLNTNKDLGPIDVQMDSTAAKLSNVNNNPDSKKMKISKSSALVLSLTYDYTLAKGLTFFAEANHFNLDSTPILTFNNNIIDNNKVKENNKDTANMSPYKSSGKAFLIGTKYKF